MHMHIRPLPDGTWLTPASTDVLQVAGLQSITTYIQKHREHVMEFTKNLPIYTQCKTSKPTKATSTHMYWWLLPNDIINPPATPNTTITSTHHRHNQNRFPPSQPIPRQFHYHNNTRPTMVLLNNPHTHRTIPGTTEWHNQQQQHHQHHK